MPTDKPTDLRAAIEQDDFWTPQGFTIPIDPIRATDLRAGIRGLPQMDMAAGPWKNPRTVHAVLVEAVLALLPPGDEPVYAVTERGLAEAMKASEWGCSESSDDGTHNDCYPDHGASEVLRELWP